MCEAVGHPVKSLERVAFGPLRLGDLPSASHRRADARQRSSTCTTWLNAAPMRVFALRGANTVTENDERGDPRRRRTR